MEEAVGVVREDEQLPLVGLALDVALNKGEQATLGHNTTNVNCIVTIYLLSVLTIHTYIHIYIHTYVSNSKETT